MALTPELRLNKPATEGKPMKNKLMICALALVAATFAATAGAEARNYIAYKTTAVRLADQATIVVTGKLLRVENVQVTGAGIDAARWARKDSGSWQDGEAGIRREAVLQVTDVLKGTAEPASELRFVSMRQLKFDAYDADLRTGEAVYFIAARPEDSRNIVIMDERGTISAPESNGSVAVAADFVRGYLAAPGKGAFADKLIGMIDLRGGRLSVDACVELSMNHADYTAAMTEPMGAQVISLAGTSKSGTAERNGLITAIGRLKPTGGMDALFEIMLADGNWSTTSLASMALEEGGNRGPAISRLLNEWDGAKTDATRMIIVRSLGLIRPGIKSPEYDGLEARTRTLDIVGGLLAKSTDKTLLREALIASRDLRSQGAHTAALKKLIDERDTNGLGNDEIKAAIVALAAARKVEVVADGPNKVTVLEKDYLKALGNTEPVLKQVVDAALAAPYTTLIVGADGKGH